MAARHGDRSRAVSRVCRGVSVLDVQDFGAQPGDLNSLGYKDGIDQPAIEGSGVDPLPGQGRPIKAGEFILGYPGEAGVPLPMPQPDILGRNGTYVGFRKYQSRVGAFNRFLRANGSTEAERELLAAKLVGRWRSGAPLTLAPDADNPALGADPQRNNNFDYANDPHGRQVPFGCHIRRMNPRDTKLTRLTDVNIHRLIRRGTTYGQPYDPNALSEEDDEVPRGAIFLFISAKAMATIEFLQQEWINDGDFIGASGERDPIIGRQEEGATFTIPKEPVRRRIHGIETFNVLRGGEYFFMPSISALNWLANLNAMKEARSMSDQPCDGATRQRVTTGAHDHEDDDAYRLASDFRWTGGRRSCSRPFSIGERRYAAGIAGRSRAWRGAC